MAMQMIKQWELAVLRVRLDLSQRTPAVVTDLLAFPNGVETLVWTNRYPTGAFGLPEGYASLTDLELRVPADLGNAISEALKTPSFGGRAALWLHIIPPHGYLGAVPWERMLFPVIGVPLLRVPDRLPVASDPGRIWTVAMIVNAAPDAQWPATSIPELLGELSSQVLTDLDIHVFADARSAAAIEAAMKPRAFPGSLQIHDPHAARAMADDWLAAKAARSPEPTRSRRTTPSMDAERWSAWIASSLRGRAVRALHIVSAALLDGERPQLAISRDPAAPLDMATTAYWDGDDVLTLATSLGAALVSFGSPPDNPCDIATRMIADAVGVQRAGATIYASMEINPSGEALAAAQGFVANPPGTTPIPAYNSVFAYLQPGLVREVMTEPWPSSYSATAEPADGWSAACEPAQEVQAVYATADSVPGWVATSERYIDLNVGDLVKSSRGSTAAPFTKQAYDSGKQRALTELREIVDSHLRGK